MRHLTHLTEAQFLELGFTKEVWFDKNVHTDTVNTLKFVKYEWPVIDGIKLEVTYCYTSENGINYHQVEESAELCINSSEIKVDNY